MARQTHNAPDTSLLRQLIMGFRGTQLVHVAARLGLADRLRDGPGTPQQLAQAVGADADALRRVLRALASLGLCAETADGTFALAPLGQGLRTDAPGSVHSLAILYGEAWLWEVYGAMLHSVQTGQPAFGQVRGQPLFDYLADHPVAAAQFHQAMTGYSAQEERAILAFKVFADVDTVVDVGGGYGGLLTALLRANPDLSGILFDLASVLTDARARIAESGLGSRLSCVAGDFFAAVPSGGDLYLLKSVLHDWNDAQAMRVLRNCRRAMPEHGRLLVIERVVPPGNSPSEAKLFDINMLVVTGGRERTEPEYRTLFRAAGLHLTRVVPTEASLSLIEGMPAAMPAAATAAGRADGHDRTGKVDHYVKPKP